MTQTTIIENPRYKRQLQQEKLEEYNAGMALNIALAEYTARKG